MGRIAYEAYCRDTGNKSLISGAELPHWHSLSPAIKHAWNAAAVAVLTTFLKRLQQFAQEQNYQGPEEPPLPTC